MSPEGAVGVCGRMLIRVAIFRVDCLPSDTPSRSTSPERGVSSLPRPRRRVDLPQPFGPIIEVTCASGTVKDRLWMMLGPS